MYCIIQELELKKADKLGAYKQLAVDTNPFNRREFPQYGYHKTGERFERPIKKAYKISIHESKRVSGVVTKKQFVVTTANYYTFATDCFALGDLDDKIEPIVEKLNVDIDTVYEMLEKKIKPLQERIIAEFEKTEEYATSAKHREIIALYKKEKALFAEKYRCPDSEYDFCFNVFGELMNADYLETFKNGSKAWRSYLGQSVW